MNFFTLLVICLVGLVGYYLFLILKEDRKTDFDSDDNDYIPTAYSFEAPVEVTLEMVSPTTKRRIQTETKSNIDNTTESSTTSTNENKYSTTTNLHNNLNFDLEQYVTAEDIAKGQMMFSGFNL